MFIFFSNGNGSAFENSLDSGQISFRKRPCAMYKDNGVANVVAETGRDLVFGTTARLSDLSMPLTGEVRRSPEPSARPSAAADSEERQICTTCLFAESVGLCLCFLPSCVMYICNAVGKRGSGDGQRLSLHDYGTTERSLNAIEERGSTLTWTVCTAADSEERQICTTCLFAESVGFVKRRWSYAFSHCGAAHFCLRGGWGKRGDLMWSPAVKHQRPAAKHHKQQLLRPHSGPSKAAHTWTTWRNSKYWL